MENIGVIFGGRSVEHEVSVITGMQIIENMDRSKYNPIPIYITKSGKFLSGDSLKNFKSYKNEDFDDAVEVFFKPIYGDKNLYCVKHNEKKLFKPEYNSVEVFEKIDEIFFALHGTFGEDGCTQGLFELIGMPYTGCGVMSSAVGMDKVVMRKVFESESIPMTNYKYFYKEELKNLQNIVEKCKNLNYPLFVKPANLGSSIGISRVENALDLSKALEVAANYDRKVIVEEAVVNPREINVAVLGYENEFQVSAAEEPIGFKDLLRYEDKYVAGSKGAKSSQKNQNKKLPADLTPELEKEIKNLAKKSFAAIDASGVARIDFLVDGDKAYVNEINTLPGSIAFYLFEVEGIKIEELITKLIELGFERHKERAENNYSIDSNLFNMTSYGAKI
ncbi:MULTISPECIES: D-alanine--D-alanine ligase family protein [Peptoniphilus]|uniref:D-alanine--D-alanine ligase family protein n=1 Tax=Peptoniphilus TaxID=162289 RepID=UPI000288841F|nr:MULTISPECIES: D-alanine--D-alanine ligase family protein [Peptoniphilus]MDU1042919.1 D-alanine--D-alanine ligase family protein [Peptoniphilus rhinitidis]MDU2109194.1 D-alanine--D-alanine ligase family protein [Peptoniphilus lacydonensis]MDU2115092.1 D-alanine--D-alanine ligase family protein [Peptoniphilus lacydonensis]MDU3750198.1 D-alanine--D-alanine ligase family protein [Peptoniphilus rhinitidis]MDU7302572.1 D-alanine--D-alanine ligase family protein [Peptoniphilus lacydonensis]